MDTLAYYKESFDRLQAAGNGNGISDLRNNAFRDFTRLGIPTVRNEEWKYTRISGLFNTPLRLQSVPAKETSVTESDLDAIRIPGAVHANELVFINGVFSKTHSKIVSSSLVLLSLDEAAKHADYSAIVKANLGHSQNYLKDGINALNTALAVGGIFVHVPANKLLDQPVYIYNIVDARNEHVLSQPRSLVHLGSRASLQVVETYATLGTSESLTNEVLEIVIEEGAHLEYYKVQNDLPQTNQVSTLHIRQTGKSYVHTVVVSLGGNIIRNNLNIILEAPYCEAHLYGLYFGDGHTHIDNHTIVDNTTPNGFSNELYKGVLGGQATGVFNGKIYVRQDAQKTNAYQSNKNILLSDAATVNTKPQLEIFADDVKCSHGCTVGQLDEEGLFYLRSRGISDTKAKALLLHAFVMDVIEQIKPASLQAFVDELITKRLESEKE